MNSDRSADEGPAAEHALTEAAVVACPYCGASVELLVDAGGGPLQEYVEDCEACCRPWAVRVTVAPDGTVSVSVRTLDE